MTDVPRIQINDKNVTPILALYPNELFNNSCKANQMEESSNKYM